jgi:hypothetical protein
MPPNSFSGSKTEIEGLCSTMSILSIGRRTGELKEVKVNTCAGILVNGVGVAATDTDCPVCAQTGETIQGYVDETPKEKSVDRNRRST